MNHSLLHAFRLTVLERNLNVYGVHVYQKDEGSIEHRFRSDDNVNLYSASKTFTSVGVGICLDDGLLQLTDKVLFFFPEYRSLAAQGSGEITVLDLLHMASGKESFWCAGEQEREMDVAETFFRLEMTAKPGERFFYSNYCTYMLGRIIEAVTGKLLRDYLLDKLFIPLDIPNPQWDTCPKRHTLAASGLHLKTSQLAKLGRLLLQEGEYEGQRIVGAEYVRAMQTDIISTHHASEDPESASGYGYQVWKCTPPGIFRADGMYGQFSIVVPSKAAVITLTSHNEHAINDIIRAVFSDILPLL